MPLTKLLIHIFLVQWGLSAIQQQIIDLLMLKQSAKQIYLGSNLSVLEEINGDIRYDLYFYTYIYNEDTKKYLIDRVQNGRDIAKQIDAMPESEEKTLAINKFGGEATLKKTLEEKAETLIKNKVSKVIGLSLGSIVASNGIFGDPCPGTYKILEVDFTSIRGVNSNNATFSNVGLIENTLAADWAKSKALKLAGNIFNRFKSGNPEIQLDCIRNSTTNDIDIGDFVLVNSNILPNQALRTRGGTRIYQVTDKNIDGISINFGLFDSGINATMNTPSFGSFVGTNANAISSSITTTDNANVEIECAIVTQGDAQPSANSTSWLLRTTVNVSSSTKPILLTNLPEGRTVYLRARSFNPDNTDIKLPSAYAYSSGYTLNGIAAPTNVIVSNITNRSATVNWSNTNSFYLTEVLLASPAGVPNTSIIQLPASSSTYTLIGLNENTSTSHTVGVRYVDSFGGFSSMASASFVASGSATKLDAPAALTLYIKR